MFDTSNFPILYRLALGKDVEFEEYDESAADDQFQPIPVKAVIPRSLGTRSQRINPWIPADGPAATICRTEAGYQLKEREIRPIWQMYRVLTGA